MNITFQDRIRPVIEELRAFHDHSITMIVLLTVLTLYLTVLPTQQKSFNNFSTERQEIEVIWTILPFFFLCVIALPSMKILYLMEESKVPYLTIKVTGHQWYWSYEIPSIGLEEDSFIETSNKQRLMKTRFSPCLPLNQSSRLLITSEDVIHSWAIPSLALKVDAIPGRLNNLSLLPKITGMFYGQCSEICGTNHSFIPISVMVKSITENKR